MVWWGEPASLSVDGFLYARCVVVANGSAFYEAVLRDPAKMPKDMEFEALVSVGPVAYARRTGRQDDELDSGEVSFETFSNHAGWNLEADGPKTNRRPADEARIRSQRRRAMADTRS